MAEQAKPDAAVSILPISQATRAIFTDLYIPQTFLFFIHVGSKRIMHPTQGEIIGEEGDLLICAPGAQLTLENRPLLERDYKATGVSFSDALIREVFPAPQAHGTDQDVQLIKAEPARPMDVLPLIRDTLDNAALPPSVFRHRLLEPLIWLRDQGIDLARHTPEAPLSRVRRLIETDLTRAWRAKDVARALGMSEATMRRWLAKNGQGFSRILLNTRLEHGLALLQATARPISEIALTCGFQTPSHFSDAFRKRFSITPKRHKIIR